MTNSTANIADRKLGKNQIEFMQLLRKHRGQWRRGANWSWKAPSETIRMLEALERRGFAERTAPEAWRMTQSGRRALKTAERYQRVDDNEVA